MRRHTKEADTLKAVMQYLASRHILAFRMQSGALVNPRGRPVRFGTPGMADVLCFTKRIIDEFRGHPCGAAQVPWRQVVVQDPLWLELKSSIGKQSLEQKQFQQLVEERGHRYLLVRSLNDLVKEIG